MAIDERGHGCCRHDRVRPQGRSAGPEQHERPGDGAAEAVAEAVDQHVDHALGRSLLLGGDRRVQGLVRGPKQGDDQRAVDAAQQRLRAQAGRRERQEPQHGEGRRVRAEPDAEPRAIEQARRDGGLHDEAHEAGGRVEDGKELHQPFRAREALHGTGLEGEVDHARRERGQAHEKRDLAQIPRAERSLRRTFGDRAPASPPESTGGAR